MTVTLTRSDTHSAKAELLAHARGADHLLHDLSQQITHLKGRVATMSRAEQIALSVARDHIDSAWRSMQYALQSLTELN